MMSAICELMELDLLYPSTSLGNAKALDKMPATQNLGTSNLNLKSSAYTFLTWLQVNNTLIDFVWASRGVLACIGR